MKEIIIKPAVQVRAKTKRVEEFDAACVRIMTDIEKASAEGRYHTLFLPRPHHMNMDIQTAFERQGYMFRNVDPEKKTAQNDLYICW